jgi:hypothetical protein
MVEPCQTKLDPNCGLFNRAIGKVVDILFHPGENPNCNHLPKAVIVDFKQYCGPIWENNTPTHVPINPHKKRCNFGCGGKYNYV